MGVIMSDSKRVLLLVIFVVIFQQWDSMVRFVNPPPSREALNNGAVVLYSTSWCGYCEKTRDLLDSNDIDFYEYDIEHSTDGFNQYKALGGNGVPVLTVGSEVVKGYDVSAMKTVLGL